MEVNPQGCSRINVEGESLGCRVLTKNWRRATKLGLQQCSVSLSYEYDAA